MPRRRKRRKPLPLLLVEGFMAVAVTVNYGLVLFDLSYIHWRDFWLTGRLQVFNVPIQLPLPDITGYYDSYKGISPNPETTAYLTLYDRLKKQVSETGLRSSASQALLNQIRKASLQMIDSNPFELAGKTGTLEKIKGLMQNETETNSTRMAFQLFWSIGYLDQAGWNDSTEFFDAKIVPLIETNYTRAIGVNGEFISKFWLIDRYFQILFAIEILIRTFFIKRRYPSLNWREALLWRWYDLLLVLPILRWLRIIPVVVRLNDAGVDFEPIRAQFSRGFVTSIAGELMEVVALQALGQVDSLFRRENVLDFLAQAENTDYVDINNTNETEAIARRLAEIIVYKVFPKIQPDISQLLGRNLELALQKLPLYTIVQQLPGASVLPNQVLQRLSDQISQTLINVSQDTYQALSVNDVVLSTTTEQLVQHFQEALTDALRDQETFKELRSLVQDLLEEIKINYIMRIPQEDFDQLLEEAEQIRQRTNR